MQSSVCLAVSCLEPLIFVSRFLIDDLSLVSSSVCPHQMAKVNKRAGKPRGKVLAKGIRSLSHAQVKMMLRWWMILVLIIDICISPETTTTTICGRKGVRWLTRWCNRSIGMAHLQQVVKKGARYKWFGKGGPKKAAVAAPAGKPSRYYPADDVPVPRKSGRTTQKVRLCTLWGV